MNEISLFYDRTQTTEITDKIDFGIVPAGELSKKQVFIKNNLGSELRVNLKLMGNNIELIEKNFALAPYAFSELNFDISPKVTEMKPIQGKVEINLKYVIA